MPLLHNRKARIIEQIRTLRAIHKTTTGKRARKQKRLPRQLHPELIKVEYVKGIRALVLGPLADTLGQLSDARIAGLVASGATERGDDAWPRQAWHRDATAAEVRAAIARMAAGFAKTVTPERIAALAKRIGERTSDFQKAQLYKQIRAALGVDPLIHEPSIAPRVAAFVEQNVALIKTVPDRFFSEIEQRVIAGVRTGARASEISAELQERFDVSESNAKRIANDQVGKFYGELNQARQTALGVENFVWRGMRDNRERPDHLDNEGITYTWADGAPGDDTYPSEGVNCRCWADPDLSGLLEGLGD